MWLQEGHRSQIIVDMLNVKLERVDDSFRGFTTKNELLHSDHRPLPCGRYSRRRTYVICCSDYGILGR